jgi:hypothetical protein
MSDQGSSNIDPRFDPAFQRGFDGSVTVTRRRAAPGTPSVTPAQDRATPTPVQARPAAVIRPPESPLDSPVVARTEAEPEVEEEVASRGANPFIIGLWVIAAVLVAGGVWGVQWARAAYLTESLTTNVDFVLVETMRVAAPFAIGLGLATVIGMLFLSATRWQRRRA